MRIVSVRSAWRSCLGAGALLAAAPEPEDPWPALARDVFKGRPLADGTGLVSIEMPDRAEDAAIVPVTLRTTLPPATRAPSRPSRW